MIHTHMLFYVTYTPVRLFSPIFVSVFTVLGFFLPQMVHLLPIPNMEWAVDELCVVPVFLGGHSYLVTADPGNGLYNRWIMLHANLFGGAGLDQ